METLFNNDHKRSAKVWGRLAFGLCACVLLGACANVATSAPGRQAHLPLLQGWFEGQAVFYVTTEVSDAEVARAKHATYAPRLAYALAAPPHAGAVNATDKVYGSVNFEQGSVFASAPSPLNYRNTDMAYSPLWRLVKVEWQVGTTPRTLKSEEEVLVAQDKGWVTLTSTQVVLNCPIVHRGALGGLPGVTVDSP